MGVHITVDYVSHRFKGQDALTLDQIRLDIEQGQRVALIGRSGCGKSTLLLMFAGLLLPTEGCVRIHGRQVTRPSAKWNMMFQRPSLYPWMTVRQNASLGLVLTGRRKGQEAHVDGLLEMVGLGDLQDTNVQQLSGGQQQRVALARSLATEPEILLLDEPFSALDAFTRSALQDEVGQIARDLGLTLVMVTHDIDEAVAMADRVLIMNANPGRIASQAQIDLRFPRDRADQRFSGQREALMRRFEEDTRPPEPAAEVGNTAPPASAAA